MSRLLIYLLLLNLLYTICESACPDQYTYNDKFNRCYKLFPIAQTYQKAQLTCRNGHAFLASIHSKEENEYLNQWIRTQTGYSYFWTGLDSLGGFWNWDDNTVVNYTAWYIGQPSISSDSCVISTTSSSLWSSIHCTNTHPFICVAEVLPTTQAPTTTMPMPCDDRYTHYNPSLNTCYYVGTSTSFWSAESFCTALSGHLASIENVFENNYIVSIAKTGIPNATEHDSTWIGAHYSDSKWYWTDGTDMKYRNFMPTRPIRESKLSCGSLIQDKLYANSYYIGFWDNLKCDDILTRFVCKKKMT